MSRTTTGKRAALYRFFDADGVLLYVGITERIGQRWGWHMRKQSWWPEVHRLAAEWYDTRDSAASASGKNVRDTTSFTDLRPRTCWSSADPWAGPRPARRHSSTSASYKRTGTTCALLLAARRHPSSANSSGGT